MSDNPKYDPNAYASDGGEAVDQSAHAERCWADPVESPEGASAASPRSGESLDLPPARAGEEAAPVSLADVASAPSRAAGQASGALQLATSTFLSLCMVLGMLLVARWMLPGLVENVRYRWHRGELRAEYELSAEQLKRVSIDSLAEVSRLVSQRMGPSVVHINLLRDAAEREQFERFLGGRSHPSFRYEGQGSGFIIDAEGHILTNHHVVDHAGQIEVTLSDGRRFRAEIVAIDPLTDLAVLKINAKGLMPIEWGDSDKVVVGTPVWAVGSPFGLQQTVTFGIISGKHRVDLSNTRDADGVPGGTPYGDLMQSDVALNPGNSGGPLVNSAGQVVGVNAAILGDTFRGVSFSIPSNVARQVAQLLIEQGEVPRGWLGVQLEDLDPDETSSDGARPFGVRIAAFPRGLPSPAREAGLRVGDVIVMFNGRLVTDRATLMRMIGELVAGTLVPVEVNRPIGGAGSNRDGPGTPRDVRRLEFQVHLGRRPVDL